MLLAKKDQLEFTEQYHSMTVQELSVIYSTSETTIKDMAKKLGLYGSKLKGRWTCKSDSYYRERSYK